ADKAYTAMELLNDVQGTIFNELSSKKAIDTYKRMLQRAYVDRLASIIKPASAGGINITISFGGGPAPIDAKKSDVTAIVRAQLVGLRGQLNTAAATTADKMSKIHLVDLAERIKEALDPK
ncbi:MAG: zinc-dependent metalloprotease, partial [Chitinophaga sp.]|nr:zinc-dependent metalloprotease [Chitinophaga sp.]